MLKFDTVTGHMMSYLNVQKTRSTIHGFFYSKFKCFDHKRNRFNSLFLCYPLDFDLFYCCSNTVVWVFSTYYPP